MNFAKRTLAVAGSSLLAAGLASLVAPKALHAVTALLVQITNTSANPVPTTPVGPAQPAQLSCTSFNGGDCTVTVPAGKRFDIQTVNMSAEGDPNNFVTTFYFVYTFQNQTYLMNLSSPNTIPGQSGSSSVSNQTQELHAYADPGTTIDCRGFYYATNTGFTAFGCLLVGTFTDQP